MVEPVPPLYKGMAPGVEPAALQVQPNVTVKCWHLCFVFEKFRV
jgi:hypothetical protein